MEKTFEQFTKELQEPSWFEAYRKKSFESFVASSMPSFRYGLNIIIKPEEFDLESLKPVHVENTLEVSAPEGVDVFHGGNINEMQFVQQFFDDSWKLDHKLYYFHQSFANDFVVIKIPEGKELGEPIELTHTMDSGPVMVTVLILASKNSKAQVLLHNSSQAKTFISDDVRVIADTGAKLDVVTIQDYGKDVINVQKRQSNGKKDSFVHWIDVCVGSHYTKSDVITDLNAEGAESKNLVLFLGSGEQRYDIYTASHHNSPHTYSDIVTRGVLTSKAKALSRGLVKINSNANGSNGYEQQDVLLLSDTAEADAIPNLEINNHDVKCSHGSTIGQLDKDQVFYMMSRGLSEYEAKLKIVEGYFTPILELFKHEDVRKKVHKSIVGALQ